MDLAAKFTKVAITFTAVLSISACSSGLDVSSEEVPVDGVEKSAVSSSTSKPSESTTSSTDPPRSTTTPEDSFVATFRADTQYAVAGLTYSTITEVPFTFSVPEDVFNWLGIHGTKWAVTIISESDNSTAGPNSEPGINLSVAEAGASVESVVDAITKSQAALNYTRSQGRFGGREVIILDASNTGPAVEFGGDAFIFTGEESHFRILLNDDRQFRSHIFQEDSRVFIVSVDSSPSDHALVLAEFAPLFESLEVGDESG